MEGKSSSCLSSKRSGILGQRINKEFLQSFTGILKFSEMVCIYTVTAVQGPIQSISKERLRKTEEVQKELHENLTRQLNFGQASSGHDNRKVFVLIEKSSL